MGATVIDGRAIAAEIRNEVRTEAGNLRAARGIVPGLAFILVGNNPASESYVGMKGKACAELGFYSITEKLPASTSEQQILDLIRRCNADSRIHGILVQLPLPSGIREEEIINAIDPRKDVDGFHPVNAGKLASGREGFVPCTPLGVQELLLRSGNDPAGRHVVILGRSMIVGRPLANLLLRKQRGGNAVVTVVHTGAKDIARYTRQADILVAAMGKAEFVTAEMVRAGAVVIDVGINRIPDPTTKSGSRLVGDVHYASVSLVASAITPVPGGVGPMTIAMLMRNTLRAAMQWNEVMGGKEDPKVKSKK